ncbi:MAG: hypothetical protein WAL04_10205, partial [Acidimicrobiales bacterium]
MTSRAEEGLRASLAVAAEAREAADLTMAAGALEQLAPSDSQLEALSRDALSAPAAGMIGSG